MMLQIAGLCCNCCFIINFMNSQIHLKCREIQAWSLLQSPPLLFPPSKLTVRYGPGLGSFLWSRLNVRELPTTPPTAPPDPSPGPPPIHRIGSLLTKSPSTTSSFLLPCSWGRKESDIIFFSLSPHHHFFYSLSPRQAHPRGPGSFFRSARGFFPFAGSQLVPPPVD